VRAPTLALDQRTRVAAGLGVLGAAATGAGTFLDWFTITVGGVTAPGGSATGWEGRDGRTVLAAAVVGLVASVLVALGTPRLAPKFALIVAGAVGAVIAVAGILDTSGKAESVQEEFAIPADRVTAEVGSGPWLVLLGGALVLAAGIVARSDPGSPLPGGARERAPQEPRRQGPHEPGRPGDLDVAGAHRGGPVA